MDDDEWKPCVPVDCPPVEETLLVGWSRTAHLPRYCHICGRFEFGPNACQCPGSGLLAGYGGTLNLGLERESPLNATNNLALFYEEFTSLLHRDPPIDEVLTIEDLPGRAATTDETARLMAWYRQVRPGSPDADDEDESSPPPSR